MKITNSVTLGAELNTVCLCVCTLFVSPVKNNSGVTPAGQCGTWVKEPDGGFFTSPNYPEKYPPERECVYIIEGEAFILTFHSFCFTSSTFLLPALDLSSSSQPLPASASTCFSMRSIPSSHHGSVSLTTSRSVMGPLVSRPLSVATVARKAPHMSAPVEGTCTSSLWLMENWRPLVSLPVITSHMVSDA